MKAVIVECSNSTAVALCDDGIFRKVKNKDYAIGQELFIKENAVPNHIMQKLSICASLALFLLSFVGIGSYSYVKPYSYVSLDINPSIEYALNRFDKVIAVSGVNDKGQQVVSSIESDVKNQNITKALGVTIKQLEKENYIVPKEYNHVIVSVCSSNDTKAQAIASSVNSFSQKESADCSIDTMTVSKEIKDNADSLGITPGKLALIHAVAETSSISVADFDVSEWTDKTVSELETTIQQASSQPSDPAAKPIAATVIDSEYLSSVLDEDTTTNPDSTADFSSADKETGSTTADTQTNNNQGASSDANTSDEPVKTDSTDHASADSNTSTGDHADNASDHTTADSNTSTGDHVGNASDNTIADSNASTGDHTDKDAAGETGQTNQTGQTDPGNTKKNPEKDDSNSSSKENQKETGTSDPAAPGVDNGDGEDVLTEDSSSKKDSYPTSNTDQVADFTKEDHSNLNDSESNGFKHDGFEPDSFESGISEQEGLEIEGLGNSEHSAGSVNQLEN